MIYLLHSDIRLGTAGRNGAQHYLGCTEDDRLWERLTEHATGRSTAAIVRAYIAAGANLTLVEVWPRGGRALERYLKRAGHLAQRCYLCGGRTPSRTLLSLPAHFREVGAFSRRRYREGTLTRRMENGALRPGSAETLASPLEQPEWPALHYQTTVGGHVAG